MRRLIGIATLLAATSAPLVSAPVEAAPHSIANGAANWVAPEASTRTCKAIAHRMGSTPTIDGNTLEALRRSTRMGVRAEVDFAPTDDGLVAFHPNRWEQGSDGEGRVWDTTQAYAAELTTTPNGQHVPSAAEVLAAARDYKSRLLIELHHWSHWQPEFLSHLVHKIDQLDLWDRVWITGTRGAIKALHEFVDATVLWRLDGESDITVSGAQRLGVDLIGVSRGAPVSIIRQWRDAGYPVTGRQSRIVGYAWAMSHRILTLQTNTPAAWLRYCNTSLH